MNKFLTTLFAGALTLSIGASAFAATPVKAEASGLAKVKAAAPADKQLHKKAVEHKTVAPAPVSK
jgi:hypothetical protein